jgi:voltage-gated potassium channel
VTANRDNTKHDKTTNRDKIKRHRVKRDWEGITAWPLMTAAALFLAVYTWIAVESPMPSSLLNFLTIVLVCIWVAFFIDFVVRVALSTHRWAFIRDNPVDLLSVVVPIARPFRLLTYLRKVPALRANTATSLRTWALIIPLSFVIMFIYVIALAVLMVERGASHANITTFGDAVWWACVTVTTVGYGDFYPVTVIGRVLAVLLMIGGIGIIAAASAIVVSYLNDRIARARRHHPELTRHNSGELSRQHSTDSHGHSS